MKSGEIALIKDGDTFTRVPITQIVDLREAILHADMTATQYSNRLNTGSLAYAEVDGVICSTARIGGKVAIQGPLSSNLVSTSVGPNLRPGNLFRRTKRNRYNAVFMRARAYIHDNLTQPMSLDEIARAAHTTRRTLCRAFAHVLEVTPQAYVRKRRLVRIRHDLASNKERMCTITTIANHWGISELGRFAKWYHDEFGELPSETLKRNRGAI